MSAPAKSSWKPVLVAVVAICAAIGFGYLAWQQRTELLETQGELLTAQKRVRALGQTQSSLENCEGTLEKEKTRCEAAANSVDELRKDLNASRSELEQLRKQREETAERLASFKELTEKFKKMIDSGQLDVVIRDGRMMVKLPASVLFASGSSELSREGELALMEVAIVLRTLKDRMFLIEGHTDNRPVENAPKARFANNWELSTARAVTVVQFLIEAKLRPESLIAAGRGEFDPTADNKTSAGRQENRRIEIVLLPKVEEVTEPDSATDRGR